MKRLLVGMVLFLAACTVAPVEDAPATHSCVTAPSGLVECSEVE
ncbi:hypothetical protein [Roseinatronobacter alkalisoli]|uniref:Lipoprotein n=1 Tax=Roseinatronobacter alkalisoli TaxID=3028235 RepID=A0ABT5T709_9RHOB|nr:hypothetical protein [Roseinatronobacter sp. HJB301]MDD7970913.1 hypothetical protein [Roseinatronobacter sp. HJB301]